LNGGAVRARCVCVWPAATAAIAEAGAVRCCQVLLRGGSTMGLCGRRVILFLQLWPFAHGSPTRPCLPGSPSTPARLAGPQRPQVQGRHRARLPGRGRAFPGGSPTPCRPACSACGWEGADGRAPPGACELWIGGSGGSAGSWRILAEHPGRAQRGSSWLSGSVSTRLQARVQRPFYPLTLTILCW